MFPAFFRSPRFVSELRKIQEARERIEEALSGLGPGADPARQTLGLIEEAQQFLRMVVPPHRWPKQKKRGVLKPEEAVIVAQNSLRSAISSFERHSRLSWGERERVLSLLKRAFSLCASAELEHLFYLGLPKHYGLLERIRWEPAKEFGSLLGVILYSLYFRAFYGKGQSELWFEELLSLGASFVWRFLAKKLGPGPGVWWRRWQYIWRSLVPYFVFLLGLAGIWLAAPAYWYPIGLTAVFSTGLAVSFFWQALRALRAPKNALIRCTGVCHSIFAPAGEVPRIKG